MRVARLESFMGRCRGRRAVATGLAWAVASLAPAADVQVVSRHAVATDAAAFETSPTLGLDGLGPYVVYTSQPLDGGSLGPGRILLQRLRGAAPIGAPLQLSDGLSDDQMPDANGGRVVYTAFDGPGVGETRVYDTDTGFTSSMSASGPVREAKIEGRNVVWIEGLPGATTVQFWDLNWAGTGIVPFPIAGPMPPATNVDIGRTYAVWDERLGSDRYVVALALETGERTLVASDPAVNERLASTSGDWVVWEESPACSSPPCPERTTAVRARNLATGEQRTVADGPHNHGQPAIDGDYVVYESDADGDYDLYLYRLSDGGTFRLTDDPEDQFLANISGNLVAYVDDQAGSLDVYVLRFDDRDPVAVAGPDQTARVGSSVVLDGSASYDPGGLALASYRWSVASRPTGSVAEALDPGSALTGFVPDRPGDYVLTLVVTIEIPGETCTPVGCTPTTHTVASLPDTVTVSSANVAPVAEAGPDQAVLVLGTTITLDGRASYDADGDPIGHAWTMLSKPAGSGATLAGADTTAPVFTADLQGEYRVQLVVSDPWGPSLPDVVTVSFTNLRPVADAGPNQTAEVGGTVQLDGGGSHDANGDPLAYRWSVVSAPAGSAAVLDSTQSPVATLAPDVAGSYVVSLVVNDGILDSLPSNATVTALSLPTQATEQVSTAIAAVNLLDPAVFKNRNMQHALTAKLQAVLTDIAAARYADAANKLTNDVLRKTDGCAVSGAPDRNDWLEDCGSQALVYPILIEAIQLLNALVP